MSSALRYLALIAAVIVLPIFGYLIFIQYDIYRVRSFCMEFSPGTPANQLAAIAENHNIDKKWIVDSATVPVPTEKHTVTVLVPSTMGELSCDIEITKGAVVSAAFLEP